MFEVNPWWYFTSPSKVLSKSNSFPSNSLKISLGCFLKMFVKVFSRPRWAIPITKYSTPNSDPFVTIESKAGINASPPSIEKRFCPTNFFPRKDSKLEASLSFLKSWILRSFVISGRLLISIFVLNHSILSGSRMYINSIPMDWQ